MKHPSRWPYIVRLPICMALVCLVWWGPLFLGLVLMKRLFAESDLPDEVRIVFSLLWSFGWSILILRTLVFRVIEPYFQAQSLQNPHHHLFRPRPKFVRSFREWYQAMCKCEDEEAPTAPSSRQKSQR